MMAAVFITIHNALDNSDDDSSSQSTAPAATAAPPVGKDTDSDGVADEDDKCPNTPASIAVNKIDCSEKEKASAHLVVEFKPGSAELSAGSDNIVQELADFLKKFPEASIEISGHTDSLGSDEINRTLSQKRAESVKEALVKKGIEANRLTAKGYGSSRPVASNKTKEGRNENRRVTVETSISVDKKK